MRGFPAFALVLAAALPAAAHAIDVPARPGPPTWFVTTDFIGGISSAPGSFAVLPPGATGGDQTSYQPQEYFGAGVGIGYQFSAWGVPFRAVLNSSLNFRHDTDVEPLPAATPDYKGNLQTFDLRLSLLADVVDFGWGRFYLGGGIGGARVRSEVEFENSPTSVVNVEWKASPSFEAGIAFTGFSSRVIPHVAYRYRWVGETESGAFADGSKVRYSDFNIHDLMFGFTIPLQRYTPTTYVIVGPTPRAIPGESFWTGFHAGAFGGWALAHEFTITQLTTAAGATVYPGGGYGLDSYGPWAGGEIGVDWQGGWVVLGLAGEAGLLSLDGDATDPASGGNAVTRLSSDWYGGMSLRAGLAYQRFLGYGRVGVFYLNADGSTSDAVAGSSASDEDIVFGWFLGAGLEYAISDRWSLGAEYRYFHPNDDVQPAGTSGIGAVSQGVGLEPINAARASVNFRW